MHWYHSVIKDRTMWLSWNCCLILTCLCMNSSQALAEGTTICDEQWVKDVEEAITAPNKAYSPILEKVPHWRDKVMSKLMDAAKACDSKLMSLEPGERARDAMNLLEEGVEREYYSQENMERLKGLLLSKAPEGIITPLKRTIINDGITGGGIGLIILIGFFVALSRSAGVHPLDLIITSDDNRFSLSRLQFWLWFVVVIISWGAISWATRRLYAVPDNLYILMGVNVAATVASSAITAAKGTFPRAGKPNFFRDIFMDSKKTLDLPRVQMFVWTLIILVGYVAVVIEHYRQALPSLPNIPEGLIVLMGLSHGAYLGAKATEKNTDTAKPKLAATSTATIAAIRKQSDATQKQKIDQLVNELGFTTWDNFMDGNPHPPAQEKLDELFRKLKNAEC